MNTLNHESSDTSMEYSNTCEQFVTLRIDKQLFGIPVAMVEDVLTTQNLTPVPLAPKEVKGLLNLRGRTIVAIDIRTCLGLIPLEPTENNHMNMVVSYHGELYSLIVDSIGDVLNLPKENFSTTPENLSDHWKNVAAGVFALEEELLVSLKISRLLELASNNNEE